MKNILLLLVVLFNFSLVAQQNKTPIIKENASYQVQYTSGVVYGKGLTHETLNSEKASKMDLLLDIYQPESREYNRPALVLIHGGGFKGGSRQTNHFKQMGNYFASRGWVVFSISYRLLKHKGTVPEEWKQFGEEVQGQSPKRKAQIMAIYPALRDAKAAMRWIAANANEFGINMDYLTVLGSSAGAFSAIGIGVSNTDAFTNEISANTDPTLKTTNLEHTFKVRNLIDLWGGMAALEIHHRLYGTNQLDSSAPPIMIVHGTKDPTVEFSEATKIKSAYEKAEVPCELIALEGIGHGAWNTNFNGKNLTELCYDYMIEQQKLIVE
ncbi:alpha/beta hydrolase [Urechidicola sp. KH5]